MRIFLLLMITPWMVMCGTPAETTESEDREQIRLTSPGGELEVIVTYGSGLMRWSVRHGGDTILDESSLAMHLEDGTTLGTDAVLEDAEEQAVDEAISTRLYKKERIRDHFHQLRLDFAGDFGLELRAYDDGAAYRFFTSRDEELTVMDEEVNFNFTGDYTGYIPYLESREQDRYASSFESFYGSITNPGE